MAAPSKSELLKLAADSGRDPDRFMDLYNKNSSYTNGGKDTISRNVAMSLLNGIKEDGGGGKVSLNNSGGDGSGGIVDTIKNLLSAQSSRMTYGDQGEFKTLADGMDLVFDKTTGKIKTIGEISKGVFQAGIKDVTLYYKQQEDLLENVNTKTSLTGELSRAWREEITNASPAAARIGVSFQELSNNMTDLITGAGRFKLVSQETIEQLTTVGKAYFDRTADAIEATKNFQNVSRGAADAMRDIEKAGNESLSLGLNAKETTKTLSTNIDKLNQFGFQKGIEGLTTMIQKSQALKMNMDSVFKVAEDVMDPEKALSLSANLAVVGGAFGDLADPLRLLYDSTNNVGALQDAIVGSTEGLATFDRESGTFQITGENLRKARAQAQALNMDFKEYSNLAVQAAQRTSAFSDLAASGLSFKDDKDKEFLTNLAQMKDGKMVIEVPKSLQSQLGGSTVALESMTEAQKETLLTQREAFKKMTAQDIAQQQAGFVENINRNVSFLAATARIQAGSNLNNLVKQLGFDPAKVGKEINGLADSAAKGINTVGEEAKTYVKNNVGKHSGKQNVKAETSSISTKEAEAKKAEAEKGKAQAENAPKEIKHTIEIKSADSWMDGIKKNIQNDTSVTQAVKNSYLNVYSD